MRIIKGHSIENGIINGGVFDLPLRLNFGIVYINMLKKYGSKTCLIDGITNEKICYEELIQRILNAAASLSTMGVKQGDVVAICSENRIEFQITVFAVIYVGGIANFINCAYSEDELIHTLKISKPKYMFFSPTTYEKYYETVSKLGLISKHFVFGKATGTAVCFDDLVLTNVDINSVKAANTVGSETAIIVYSSGTTGLPKGVKWTHQALSQAIFQPLCTKRQLVFLGIAPWSNTIGFMLTMQTVVNGMTMVFLAKFTEETYLQTIEKYKVGLLLAVPPLIVLLSKSKILDKYNVSTVKLMQCGGSVLELKTINEVKKRLPNLEFVLQGYGMSEATGLISTETDDANNQGSNGKIVPGIIAKFVDTETRKILGPKKVGEICIKGSALFGGYVGEHREDDYDEDGFYKTGDIAYYDEEGYVFIVDRIKELIKFKTWQVPPSELEAVLLQHPGVKDAAMIGVPDHLAGELPYAFVVKQLGANVTEKEIVDFVASKVSPWKRLRGGVQFIQEIPKNGSGKILRRELKKMLQTTKSKI